MTNKNATAIVAAIVGALLIAATGFPADNPVTLKIRERIDELWTTGALQIGGAQVASREMLPDLYERNCFEPLWQNPQNVRDLIAEIGSIAADGLNAEDYHLFELLALKLRRDHSDAENAALLADYDILLTDSLIRLSYHLLFGKVDPEHMHPDWNMGREVKHKDPVAALERRLRAGTLAEGLKNIRPRYKPYRQLKAALKRYRAIQEAGGWDPVPAGPTLKPGMTDARIVDLRRRLAASAGDAGSLSASAFFDGDLEKAVRRFQERHHLESDGFVGKNTLAALNIPVKQKIDQIRVNLERARWVLHKLPPEHLRVDIAGFRVYHYQDEAVLWSSKIQVGKPYRNTPVFKSKIKYIVFNPTWTVPPTILKEDILPKLSQHPGYLQENKIAVIARDGTVVDPATIDWSQYKTGYIPYTLRQLPGPHNALGRMKFIFPNRHFIYMHDTPSRNLFKREERATSSGCIRVEKYIELAQILLNDPIQWSPEKIQALIDTEKTQQVTIALKMPVILIYCTVFVDENGEVFFKKDLYDRDQAVLDGLNEAFEIWQRRAFN